MRIADFELERYFAAWEFTAPYVLCASDIEAYRLDELLGLADDEGLDLWHNLALGYTESAGHPRLRAEIASLYAGVLPEEILVFSGAEEAIFVCLNVLLGRGDHAIVVWPAYQSLYEVARATGAHVTLLRLEHAAGWALDVRSLRAALRPATRLIVINFPHNPTGALLDHQTFSEVVELAREAKVRLLSDEVYRLLEFDPADRLPAAVETGDGTLSMGVMSKAFALAGLRIGWLASHDVDLLRRLAAFKDYTTICCSAPSEILALIALRAREAVLARSGGIIGKNLPLLDRFFAEWGEAFEWIRPRAGSVAFPRLRASLPVERFTAELLEREGVLLAPGSVFQHPGNHFRIGFGRRNLPEALERLARFSAAP
jgi:aspartate/methionine/tyrosine aminotransferase